MLVLAPRTSALAASHVSPEAIARLEAAIAAVEAARGSEAAVPASSSFRQAVRSQRQPRADARDATRHALLAPSLRRMIDRVPQARSRILVAQRCIVEALRKGDPGEASPG